MRHHKARTQARRRQILEAAEACFRARGFHAATIAEIAASAGLSVGQIYRFFECKEALVEAIADRQMRALADVVAEVNRREGAAGDAVRRLLTEAFDRLSQPGAAALLLEVTAEASRDPRVAAIVQEHDRHIRCAMSDLLAKAHGPGASEPAGRAFGADVLCLILEGAAVRLIRNPRVDRRWLAELQGRLAAELLGAPEPPRAACNMAQPSPVARRVRRAAGSA